MKFHYLDLYHSFFVLVKFTPVNWDKYLENMISTIIKSTFNMQRKSIRFNSCYNFISEKMGKKFKVSESARNQLNLLHQKYPSKNLKIIVEPGGCHGFQYNFTLFDNKDKNSEDLIFSNGSLSVYFDSVTFDYIKYAELDYKKELIGSSFSIKDNPIVATGCGCGISFDLKSNENEI